MTYSQDNQMLPKEVLEYIYSFYGVVFYDSIEFTIQDYYITSDGFHYITFVPLGNSFIVGGDFRGYDMDNQARGYVTHKINSGEYVVETNEELCVVYHNNK